MEEVKEDGQEKKKSGITVQKLYDHIVSQITPETALMRMLESSVIKYERLRFEKGEELHPLIIISMASLEMGWGFLVEEGHENVEGLIVGTDEYIKRWMPKKDKENPVVNTEDIQNKD